MPLKKIDVCIVSLSKYHVLDHFAEKFYEALSRAGFQCRLLHVKDALRKIKEDPSDLTMTFNGPIITYAPQQVLLCDIIKIPHLSCLVDPPYRFRWVLNSPYIILTCDDQSGCGYLKSKNFSRYAFMPHAVEPELSPGPDNERIYDLTLLATYVDCEVLRRKWRMIFPPLICNIIEKAADATFADESTTFIEAFQHLANERASEINALPNKVNYPLLYSELELYIKGRDRIEFVKSVKDVELHIFGAAYQGHTWKRYLGKDYPNVIIHDEVEFTQALEIMKKSKITVNCNIKNKYGSHERIFAGMACGAAVITNENPYLKQYFEDGQSILFFQNAKKNLINQKLKEYLKDDAKRQNLAAKGREIVMHHHTWDHRVAALMKELIPIWEKIRSPKTPN